MSARMFITLMLVLLVFMAGLFVYAKPVQKDAQNAECAAGTACADDAQVATSADGLVWESVSRHLLNVIQ